MRKTPALTISEEDRAKSIASLRRYVSEELELDIGDLKAGLLLDYIIAEQGALIYNQAIADARAFIEERAADLDAAFHRPEFPYWVPKR